jgi:hypothetical protein
MSQMGKAGDAKNCAPDEATMTESTSNPVYRLYRGAGSAAAIDYSTPIATLPATENAAAVRLDLLPCDWASGVTWFIAVRSVDANGIEFGDPAAILAAEFDSAGRLMTPRPAAPGNLSARPTAGQRLAIAWRFQPEPGRAAPAPTSFRIFLAPANTTVEQMLAGEAAAAVPAGRLTADYLYRWTSAGLSAGPWHVIVCGVAESPSGAIAGVPADVVGWVRPSQAVAIGLLTAEVR